MVRIIGFTCILLLVSGIANAEKNIAATVDDIKPLLNGQYVPNVQTTTSNGVKRPLHSIVNKQKTILFFYRGGWCPFCNTQMGQLKAIEGKLSALGYQLIGVSTDSVEMLNESTKDKSLNYQLISDFESKISQAFGLAYFTSAKTTERYLAAMDLKNPLQQNASGETRLVLPAPAIYVINEAGLVTFSYVNTNYKVRLDEQVLLSVAEHM